MNGLDLDVNADDIGFLQTLVLHRLADLAAIVAEDPLGRTAVDPDIHRQIKCMVRSIERNCGLATT